MGANVQAMAKTRDPANEIVRKNLVAFREAVEMSQDAAAQAAAVPVDNLRRYEGGRVVPPADALRRLGEIYGHIIDDFFKESPPAPQLDQRPVMFLRTLAGVEIDPGILARVEQVVREANEEARARKKPKKR